MAFPLQFVTSADLQGLCRVLWDWTICEDCRARGSVQTQLCREPGCHWSQRSQRLQPFFDFYRESTSSYVPDFFGDEDQALRGHQDVFDIITLTTKYSHTLPRKLYMDGYFASRDASRQSLVPDTDRDRAFDLAARVLTMVNPQDLASHNDDEEKSHSTPAIWPSKKCLQEILEELFPRRIHPSLQVSDPQSATIKQALSAENLRKLANVRIEGTENLLHHLMLDPSGVVYVFHHTSFLKEHLLASMESGTNTQDKKTRDGPPMPRELALETLYTLQLLFPPGSKSQTILRNLVSKRGFDPDTLRYGTAIFELPHERKRVSAFPIWGSRLMDLHDEIENPKPRSAAYAWLERRSQSRHIMLATMIGVFTAVLLGVLGLCVSVFQTWIAWKQWKSQGGS